MPPMQGGPMPMQMPPRPMRRGAPKVVPVIVSAGLAVGVFCGLLFGLGTGKDDAHAATSKDKNKKDGSATKDDNAAPEGLGATAALPPPPKAGSGSAVGSGSAAIAATGSGSGSAAKVEPTIKTVKLVVEVKPDNAAKDAKITIDGKDITGDTAELPAEQKTAKVSVHANGFHSFDKTVDLSGDETKMEVEMRPRGAAAATDSGSPGFGGASKTGPTVPRAPPGPPPPPKKKGGNNGVIDI